MSEEVSDRVIEQRLRNRVIDAVEVLARGNEGLVAVNYYEFFLAFYECWDNGRFLRWPNSAFTDEEERTVNDLGGMLDGITTETRHFQSEAQYIQSGCAERIKPMAQETLLSGKGHQAEKREEEAADFFSS